LGFQDFRDLMEHMEGDVAAAFKALPPTKGTAILVSGHLLGHPKAGSALLYFSPKVFFIELTHAT